jgi:chorismate mutase
MTREGLPPMNDTTLAEYRQSIDNIDAALVVLLAERFKVTRKVGAYKAQSGLPPADPNREQQQIARLKSLARDANLDPDFSEKFLRFIIDEVIRHHASQQVAKDPA